MTGFKMRGESGAQGAAPAISDRTGGALANQTLADFNAVWQRHFGGTAIAAIAEVSSRHVSLIAGSIDRRLGISDFLGSTSGRPQAAIISNLSNQALIAAQQDQMQRAIALIKEADEKLQAAVSVDRRGKDLDEAEAKEKAKDESAVSEAKEALTASISDAGTASAGRMQMIGEAVGFYARNRAVLGLPGMEEQKRALLNFITALGREAKEGGLFEKEAKAGEFAAIRGRIEPVAMERTGFALAAATSAMESASRALGLGGVSAEFRKAAMRIRDNAERIRNAMREGGQAPEEQTRGLMAAATLAKQANEALSAMGGRLREQVSTIFARMLDAGQAGDMKTAGVQAFIARECALAKAPAREALGAISASLESGKIRLSEAIDGAAKYISGILKGKAKGIVHEGALNPLRKLIDRLDGGKATVNDLESARIAAGLAESYKKDIPALSKNAKAQEGAKAIYSRAFSAAAGGLVRFASLQGRIAGLFGKKRMSKVRDGLEGISNRAERAAKLTILHQLVREGMKPDEAALLCAEGDESILNSYKAMADPDATLEAEGKMLEMSVFAAELRSVLAKKALGDESGIYKAAVEWLDERIISAIAGGGQPHAQDNRALFALAAIHSGDSRAMAQFLLEEPELLGLMDGVGGIETALEGVHGDEKADVQDILWSAQEAVFGGRFAEAAGHMVAASAAARLGGKDGKMLEERSYGAACEGTVSARTLLFTARAQLDRALHAGRGDTESDAYFDAAIIAYESGDFNGAQAALSLANLFARAKSAGLSDPRGQEAAAMAREILGDYRGASGRPLFGGCGLRGMIGGDGTLLERLEGAAADAGPMAGWLAGFSGEKKLAALALRVRKAEIGLGRAEMGAALLAVTDGRYDDVYAGREDRYADKAASAQKKGDAVNAERWRKEAERVSNARGLAKGAALAYEEGAQMQEQELDGMLDELARGGAPSESGALKDGALAAGLSIRAMEAASVLHDSIVNVRTDDKEDGREELERAAEGFLKAATALEKGAGADAALVSYAESDLASGMVAVGKQKRIQREEKRIEKKLLEMIAGCRSRNEENKREFIDSGLDAPLTDIYTDHGTVRAGEAGRLVNYEERARELDDAEEDALGRRFRDSFRHIRAAEIGMEIDRYRAGVEVEYRRLYPKLETAWSEEGLQAVEVMRQMGREDMQKDLFSADAALRRGDMEEAAEAIAGFGTRFRVGVAIQEIALQEWTLGRISSGLGGMAEAAAGFGFDEKVVKESGVDFTKDAGYAIEKLGEHIKLKKATNPFFGFGAHDESVRAVRAISGAKSMAMKAAELKKAADDTASALRSERMELRERQEAGDGDRALEEGSGRIGKHFESASEISGRYSRIGDGFQLWSSCAGQMLNLLDGADSIEKARGSGGSQGVQYRQIREDAGVLGQLAGMVASDPEGAVALVLSGQSVAYRMGTGDFKLREEHGGYAESSIPLQSRSGSFAELFAQANERSLHVAEALSGGLFGKRGRSLPIAKDYTGLVLLNAGIAQSGGALKQVALGQRERGVVSRALNGSGGANQMMGMFFSAPATLTSFFSTDEGEAALDSIVGGLEAGSSASEEISKWALRGERMDAEALGRLSARIDEGNKSAKKAYDRAIKEGLSDESTARGVRALFDMGLSIGLTASGFGSVAGIYGGTMALQELAFQSDRAGGFDNLSTFDQVMGVVNVGTGFADGATSFLGEIGKAGGALHSMRMIDAGFSSSGRAGRMALSFMPGGAGSTWAGRILGSTSLISGAAGIPMMVAGYAEGKMNWFEFGVGLAGSLQPVVDHGTASLGYRGMKKLVPEEGGGGRGARAKAAIRGFVFGFTGNSIIGDTEAYSSVHAIEEHGRALSKLKESERSDYFKAEAMAERGLGRPLEPEEGAYLASIIGGGSAGKDAVVEMLAKPRMDADFRMYLMRKAGEEIDLSQFNADERRFLEGLLPLDKDAAWNAIAGREYREAERILVGEGIEAPGFHPFARRVGELREAFGLLKEGRLTDSARKRLAIGDSEMKVFAGMSGEAVGDAVGLVGGSELPDLLKPGQASLIVDSSHEKAGASKEHVEAAISWLAGRHSDPVREIESEFGYVPGSSGLEAELMSRRGSVSAATGSKPAEAGVIRTARTLERMISQRDETGRMPRELLDGLCAAYPEYGGALRDLDAAHADELPHLVRQEAEAIAYSRRSGEIEAAILESGLDKETANVARIIHKSLHGERTDAGIAHLDDAVIEDVTRLVAGGMEEADAVVEAALGVSKRAEEARAQNLARDGLLDAGRAGSAVESLGMSKERPQERAEVISLAERRMGRDGGPPDGPAPPDSARAKEAELARTGTDGRVEAVGTMAEDGDGIAEGTIVSGPGSWFRRWKEKSKAGKSGRGDGAAQDAPAGARIRTGDAPVKKAAEVVLPETLRDPRAEPFKDRYEFVSPDGRKLKVRDSPQATLGGRIGSGAGCEVFSGRMMVDGREKEVAIKVLSVSKEQGEDNIGWEERMDKAVGELERLGVGSRLGVGPAPLGFVEVGGNPAIAMELVRGKPLEEMDAGEIREFVSEKTISSLGDSYWKMRNGGYMQDDFQYLVLTEDQTIGGISRSKGEVVFIDMESLKPVGESGRIEMFGDTTLETEAKAIRSHCAFAFFSEYYSALSAAKDRAPKAELDMAMSGVFGWKAANPINIASAVKMDSRKRVDAVEAALRKMEAESPAQAEKTREALRRAGAESKVVFVADDVSLAWYAREVVLDRGGAGFALDSLGQREARFVRMLAEDDKFRLNASGSEKSFKRFISNARSGAALLGQARRRSETPE